MKSPPDQNGLDMVGAVDALSDGKGSTLRKGAALIAVIGAVSQQAMKLVEWYKEHRFYTVRIDGSDVLYGEVLRWVATETDGPKARAVRLETVNASSRPDEAVKPAVSPRELAVLYDGKREQSVKLNGHTVRIAVLSESLQLNAGASSDSGGWQMTRDSLRITARTAAGFAETQSLIRRLHDDRAHRAHPSTGWFPARYGGWVSRSDMAVRDPDSVVLADGMMEALIADVEAWRNARGFYDRIGVPYRRSYLLHGPPGTGKTSVARALATHFRMDVYYLPLADLRDDQSSIDLVSYVPSGSLLILEDVDVVPATRDRDDVEVGVSGDHVSLAGLLNALDGVASPQGLVTVMTTNHVEKLDPALVRPGRVDRSLSVGYADNDQVARLFSLAYGACPPNLPDVSGRRVTTAQVVGAIKSHQAHPAEAQRELTELVERQPSPQRL